MRFKSWLELSTLASAHPKSGPSAPPVASGLIIGTCVGLGLALSFVVVWACYWRRAISATGRRWRLWLGWALTLVICVDASLWAVSFLGSGALGWVVPTLAAIVIPLLIFWLQQEGQAKKELRAETTGATKQLDQEIIDESPAMPTLLVPGDLHENADIDRETLAEILQVLGTLQPSANELNRQIEAALADYIPGDDWRIALGVPREKLETCLNLIEQLNRLPRRWVHTGKWSFTFADTVADANDAGAELRKAMKDRASGRSEGADLTGMSKRLEGLISQLDSLAKSAAIPP